MAYDGSKVRWRLTALARALARSGAHAGHHSILSVLQADAEFGKARRWLEDAAFLAQLDRLSASAWGSSSGRLNREPASGDSVPREA